MKDFFLFDCLIIVNGERFLEAEWLNCYLLLTFEIKGRHEGEII